MIVAVWNYCRVDVSKRVAALLALAGINSYGVSVALFENNINGELFGDMFIDRQYSRTLREDGMRYADRGRGEKARIFMEGKFNRRCYGNNLVTLIDDALYYGVQYNDENYNVFNENIVMRYTEFIAEAEQKADYHLIAIDRGDNSSSIRIVDDADKVVVVISPDDYDFNRFFDNYRMIRYKCIFVLVSKRHIPKRTLDHLKSMYGLKNDELFEYVETETLCDYVLTSGIMEYVKRFGSPGRGSSEYRLHNQIVRISQKVFNGMVPVTSAL